MKLSDINVSTLFINKYTRNLDYKNNYEKSLIPYHSLAIMLKGTCSLHCKGEVTSVYPGDVFLFRKTVCTAPHGISMPPIGKCRFTLCIFHLTQRSAILICTITKYKNSV